MSGSDSIHPVLRPDGPLRLPERCCVLAIISKVPQAGQVKTRLVPPLTAEEAAELHAAFLADMSRTIAGCAAELGNEAARSLTTEAALPLVVGAVVYTPIGAEQVFDDLLPQGFVLLPQGEGDLGNRLRKAVEDFLLLGAACVFLLNSDSPTLPVAVLRDAVRRLSAPGDRVVLGPAEDGGYYLIGLKQSHPEMFERIAWSTDVVMAQTVERASEIGLQMERLQTWFDVDDAEGMRRLMESGAESESGGESSRRVLEGLLRNGLAERMASCEKAKAQ